MGWGAQGCQAMGRDSNAASPPAFRVPYVDLSAMYREQRDATLAAIDAVFDQAQFILRPPVARLERKLAAYVGASAAVGVNSGTDAIYLSLEALGIGPGDEVVTTSHTFVATVAAIVRRGATPVLVDVADDGNIDIDAVEEAMTDRTRMVVPVHMNGRCCDMPRLLAACERRNLHVVEDAAQALGASLESTRAGAFGVAAGFSLHPMKVLGVGGDAGFVTTSDARLAARLAALRNHGQVEGEYTEFGVSSRLDTLHAVVAELRMARLEPWIERRREVAARYDQAWIDIDELQRPPAPHEPKRRDVYSSYVVRTSRRDELETWLRARGVECFVHWRKPMHLHARLGLDARLPTTEAISATALSLPVHAQLRDEQVEIVVHEVREFFGANR